MTEAGGKIQCKIDGAMCHSIERHLRENHPDVTLADYQAKYPGAPVLSDVAKKAIADRRAKRASLTDDSLPAGMKRVTLAETFGFPVEKTKAMGGKGDPIQILINDPEAISEENKAYLPARDKDCVFTIDLVKYVLMAIAMKKPALFWGTHGTGKSSLIKQVYAHTNRPLLRVQHTVNTEEAHVLGQYVVKDGSTVWQNGPLPMAMMYGWGYLADEYDFGLPSVLSLYQPVLEGEELVIKDAPLEFRRIKPHPEFRFFATGNTNGAGDDTGLYQGTQMQNAANYSRFGITVEVKYMEEEVEAATIAQKSGIKMADAKKLVQVATEVRKSFKNGNFSNVISPRELINAAELGLGMGARFVEGLALAFANRLSPTDQDVFKQLCQRHFGHGG